MTNWQVDSEIREEHRLELEAKDKRIEKLEALLEACVAIIRYVFPHHGGGDGRKILALLERIEREEPKMSKSEKSPRP